MAEVIELVQSQDGQRMEIRSLVRLASEPISHYWPMQTFIHHNPLHGLEHLSFGEAINQGTRFLGGKGYLPNAEYRSYYQQGRITLDAIDEALKDRSDNQLLAIDNRKISPLKSYVPYSFMEPVTQHQMWLQPFYKNIKETMM